MPRYQATAVSQHIYRPIIFISVEIGPLKLGGVSALPDSGADATAVPAEVVTALGVDYNSLPVLPRPGKSASGDFELRLTTGIIEFDGHVVCDHFVVLPPGSGDDVLLGRADFFSKFRISFSWSEMPPTFEIDPIA